MPFDVLVDAGDEADVFAFVERLNRIGHGRQFRNRVGVVAGDGFEIEVAEDALRTLGDLDQLIQAPFLRFGLHAHSHGVL